jgi:ubiquinone/menaquinone biosynthesis C-methylase UbiE
MARSEFASSGAASASSPSARAFAAVYDAVLWTGERAGMRRRREQIVGQARGRTLELGSGTGLNLPYYPADLDELILAEPEPAMRKRLRARLSRVGASAKVIDAPAESLPLEEASIDTVVCTLVLCTVDDPERALAEVARVLRPDGQLLFIEHVRSDSPLLARWQDRLVGPWQRLVEGCRCNRATARLMADGGLKLELREEPWRAMPPLIRPLIAGRATLGAA